MDGAFPSVEMASATESDVNKLWAGLGYYRRARLLHSGETRLEHNDGNLPEDREGLLKIPGIGAYTAGAIASIAFGRREPLVDGNVIRVFRGTGRSQERRRVLLVRHCWKLAASLVERSARPGDLNLALMELNTVCAQISLRDSCPLRSSCR